MINTAWHIFFVTNIALAGAAESPRAAITTSDGKSFESAITHWSTDTLTLSGEQGLETLARDQLLFVRPLANQTATSPVDSVQIELVDQSTLYAAKFELAPGRAQLHFDGGSEQSLNPTLVSLVRFPPHAPKARHDWQKIQKISSDGDLLVIRKADALDYVEGQVHEVNATHVLFETDGDTIPVRRTKVAGIFFFRPAQQEWPPASCLVRKLDNTQLFAKSIALTNRQLSVTTRAGFTIPIPLNAIQEVSFTVDKVQYLSDLEPVVKRWTPYFATPPDASAMHDFFRPRRNVSQTGRPLRIGKQSYSTGLSLRSHCELTYRLPAGFSRLQALAAIDPTVGQVGNVELIVRGDGKQLLATEIDGGAKPVAIDVSIQSVKRLTLEVRYGKNLDFGDYLNLADARITK